MTSNFIPKEKLSNYQRWEMSSLDSDLSSKNQPAILVNKSQVNQQDEIILPVQEDTTAIFQRAKTEGYTAGYQEGNTIGYKEGRKAADKEIKAEVSRLQVLLFNLNQDLHKLDQQIANDLLDLSIALAKKIVTQALKLKPELIVSIVQEAIRSLPNARQHPRLFLHPNDAEIIRLYLGDQLVQDSWSIREDDQLSRGDCRIEASGSEIDASLEVRWQRALSAIGKHDNWLDIKEG